ncbi:MAG: hypothetical protein ABRQ38_28985 [Candidatus Eremiobacterota bacterium]
MKKCKIIVIEYLAENRLKAFLYMNDICLSAKEKKDINNIRGNLLSC